MRGGDDAEPVHKEHWGPRLQSHPGSVLVGDVNGTERGKKKAKASLLPWVLPQRNVRTGDNPRVYQHMRVCAAVCVEQYDFKYGIKAFCFTWVLVLPYPIGSLAG